MLREKHLFPIVFFFFTFYFFFSDKYTQHCELAARDFSLFALLFFGTSFFFFCLVCKEQGRNLLRSTQAKRTGVSRRTENKQKQTQNNGSVEGNLRLRAALRTPSCCEGKREKGKTLTYIYIYIYIRGNPRIDLITFFFLLILCYFFFFLVFKRSVNGVCNHAPVYLMSADSVEANKELRS